MKKIALFAIVVMVVGAFSSCKPKEKCPAYGKYVPAGKSQPQSNS
jgi:hypothetical protein